MEAVIACPQCGRDLRSSDRFCEWCGTPNPGPAPVQAPAASTGAINAWEALVRRLRAATAGTYEIRGELGRGGMAVVYLAYDLRLNRKVALKLMLPALHYSEGMAERFKEEARTAAKLEHPHIVVIFAVDEVDDLLFFAMKHIDGCSLDDVVRKVGALPVPVVQMLITQVASALHYAHTEGVVHRDVKPGNVMLDRRGEAIVTDFGIAKAAESSSITQTGAVIGTPVYLSPEQWHGRRATAASDQYALGVLGYELLTGKPPFTGSTVELQIAHVAHRVRPLQEVRPDCPPELAAAIMRMLEKDPADRWPSLSDAAAGLSAGLPRDLEPVRATLGALIAQVRGGSNAPAMPVTPLSPLPATRSQGVVRERPRVTRVRLASPSVPLLVGSDLLMIAVPEDEHGEQVANIAISWSSSDPEVADINSVGRIVARAPGQVTVTARCNDAAAQAVVSIVSSYGRVSSTDVERTMLADPVPPPSPTSTGRTTQSRKTPPPPPAPPAATIVPPAGSEYGATIVAPQSTPVRNPSLAPGTVVVPPAPARATPAPAPQPPTPVYQSPPAYQQPTPSQRETVPPADDRDRGPSIWSTIPPIARFGAAGAVAVLLLVLAVTRPWSSGDAGSDGKGGGGTTDGGRGGGGGPVATRIRVSGVPASVSVGDVFMLSVTSTGGAAGPITWRSTAPDVVAIEGSGRASATRAGRAFLVASAEGATGAASDSVPVMVAAVVSNTGGGGETGAGGGGATTTASVVIIPPTSQQLRVGETLVLRARVRDGRGGNAGGRTVSWATSDARVAAVDASTGRVVAMAPGAVTVTAQLDGARSTIDLSVGAPTAASIELTGSPSSLKVGDSVQLAASVRDDRGNAIRESVAWSSSRPDVARVDPGSGLVIARAAGTAVVSASAGGIVQEKTITVQARVVSQAGGGGGGGGGSTGGGGYGGTGGGTARKTEA